RGIRSASKLVGRFARGTSRDDGEYSLCACKGTSGLDRVLVDDGDHLVDHVAVEDRRDEPRPDPLNAVRPGLASGEDGRASGLDRDDAYVGAPVLEHLADPRDRPPRANTRDEEVHSSIEVGPDLFGRRSP